MLTKSRLAAWRQCPKRLWLEHHEPLPREPETANRARGTSVGEMARRLLAPSGGETLDRRDASGPGAVARTAELLAQGRTVFEGAFGDAALLTRADVARPTAAGWDLVEVKSSGSVKDHHIEDAAIQTAAARRSGSPPGRIVVAHLDTGWVYPGDEDYSGLFVESDVTEAAIALADEVEAWILPAQAIALAPTAPVRGTGRHCSEPHACGFIDRCRAEEPAVERPLDWLPGPLRREAKALRDAGARSMNDVPDALLSDLQLRVKTRTRLNEEYFDQAGAAADLADVTGPFCFLDFETVNPPVPLWAGTRPFAQVPFQFSLHVLTEDGTLLHREFLMATGADPSRPFAEALIEALGQTGAILVYNAAFERTRIRELAERFSDLAPALSALEPRIVDLQPVAKARYYHPAQQGSWSIKAVLPCLVPELRYDRLEGVQSGTMAIDACLEMLDPACPPERRSELDAQLRAYCRLDTLAMVGLWARFTGDAELLAAVATTGV